MGLFCLGLGASLAGCGPDAGSSAVTGQLVDYHSGEAISGAVIRLVRRGWGRSTETGQVVWDRAYVSTDTTDADGRFALALPGPGLLVGFGAGRLEAEADGFQELRGVRAEAGAVLQLQTVARREDRLPGGTLYLGRYPDGRAFGWSFVEARAVTELSDQDLRLDRLATGPLEAVLSTVPPGGLLFVPIDEQGVHVASTDYLLRYLDAPPASLDRTQLTLGDTTGTIFLRTPRGRHAKLAWDPGRAISAGGAVPELEEPADRVVSLRYVYRPLPGSRVPFEPPLRPVDPLHAAAAEELDAGDSQSPAGRTIRPEVRDDRGQPLERHHIRLESGVPRVVDGCTRDGGPVLRFENLLLSFDDEGLPRVRLTLVTPQSVHQTLPQWVSRRVESTFDVQVPWGVSDLRTLQVVLQEVGGDGPNSPMDAPPLTGRTTPPARCPPDP